MVFVPVPPPSHRLTQRARDLADHLEREIESYRRQYPELSDGEIRAALTRAAGTAPVPGGRRQALALVVGLLAAFIGGLMVFFRAEGGGGGGAPAPGGGGEGAVPMVAVAVGVGVLLVLLMVKLRRRDEERD